MNPDLLETYLQQLEPPTALTAEAQHHWRAETRRHLLALAAAYEELGHAPEEALQAALRHLQAGAQTPAADGRFPTFRAAGRWARSAGPRLVPRASGLLRRLGAVTAVGVLLLCLASLVMNVIAGRALERELTAIRARGEPLTLREAAPPEIPATENAALVYAEAFRLLGRTDAVNLPDREILRRKEQEKALQAFLTADEASARAVLAPQVRAFLIEAAPALARARVAAAMPRCRFPVNWEDGAGALFPHYAPLRLLAKLLAAHAITATQTGQVDAAMADLTAVAQIARHMGEPLLIGQLVQYACLVHTMSALERLLEGGTLNETQCRRLDALLAEMELHEPFERAMQTERCLGMWAFDFARRDPAKLSQLMGTGVEAVPLFLPRLWLVGKPLLKLDEVCYLRQMGQRIALAGERRPIGRRGWAEEPPRLPQYAVVTRVFLPIFARAVERRDETLARLGLARWALALHRYQQETGSYPAAAEAAAQTLGGGLPNDPFTNRAFHYRRQGNGYLLYSVGANGRDDGGRGVNDRPRPHPVLSRFPPREDRQYDDVVWRVKS